MSTKLASDGKIVMEDDIRRRGLGLQYRSCTPSENRKMTLNYCYALYTYISKYNIAYELPYTHDQTWPKLSLNKFTYLAADYFFAGIDAPHKHSNLKMASTKLVNKKGTTSPIQHFGFGPNKGGQPGDLSEVVCSICAFVILAKDGQTRN